MYYPPQVCPVHPKCKACVVVNGHRVCYECWNNDPRPINIKYAEADEMDSTITIEQV